MNQAELDFVRWTQKHYPPVYHAAIAQVARKGSLGGLGDDLSSSVSFDPSAVSVSDSAMQSIDSAVNSASGNSWSDIISSVANAIGTVAPAIVKTKADLSAIQINQQRAAAGLTSKVTGASLISGQVLGMSSGVMLGVAALVLGGLLLSGRRSSR
jgi:hypothetical protein